MRIVLTLAAGAVLMGLGSCATMSEDQCLAGDWYGQGRTDGAAGHGNGRVASGLCGLVLGDAGVDVIERQSWHGSASWGSGPAGAGPVESLCDVAPGLADHDEADGSM